MPVRQTIYPSALNRPAAATHPRAQAKLNYPYCRNATPISAPDSTPWLTLWPPSTCCPDTDCDPGHGRLPRRAALPTLT
jgi:hypothetical protein